MWVWDVNARLVNLARVACITIEEKSAVGFELRAYTGDGFSFYVLDRGTQEKCSSVKLKLGHLLKAYNPDA